MKKILTILLSIVCLSFFLSSCSLLDKAFPKANPIRYPNVEDITELTIFNSNNKSKINIIDETDIDKIINNISNSEPTRNKSVNDQPYVGHYYFISIKANNENYYYYLYKENGKTYIEKPYVGIYRVNNDFLTYIEGLFN
ncbi:MAG: DUF5301 domain-containing protein [Clostridia bacterium]|nr:DUF5301 domain-containing protein [Clostridia bacterium]